MATKTVWEHIIGEPVASPPGETLMKSDIDARFEGTVEQFIAWVSETFKNPGDMRVKAVVGNSGCEVGEPRKPTHITLSADAKRLVQEHQVHEGDAEGLIKGIRAMVRKNNNIGAIKWLRERTKLGLKEAKDFVESLPKEPAGVGDEESPF
jgi:hypothetical protein